MLLGGGGPMWRCLYYHWVVAYLYYQWERGAYTSNGEVGILLLRVQEKINIRRKSFNLKIKDRVQDTETVFQLNRNSI